MGYPNLKTCITDLEKHGQLVRISVEIDPYLEAAEIQRRVYQKQGPAILFERVKNCRFPMVSNLFGTIERCRFLFRDTLEIVQRFVELKTEPGDLFKKPWRFRKIPFYLPKLLPKFLGRSSRKAPIFAQSISLRDLPQLVCWPKDGGSFITLPMVYTESCLKPGWRHSNLGMYRVQLCGNDYIPDREIGLHYQIHRGIGVHHAQAIAAKQRLAVQIWVGGPPALTVAAVMPLPEGLPELAFAGLLGGRRLKLARSEWTAHQPFQSPVPAEVDFCIQGWIDPEQTKPEGPFGDHLGYYSLTHPFPVMTVEKIYARRDAIWPFTVVGRPPQEDTSFGALIHELTGPVIPAVIPGVQAVHAVDAAGVHPLLLAMGSERYMPYSRQKEPQELLTQANAILGQGQLSLAKYLLIVAKEDNPELDIHNIQSFLVHLLERVDWRRDLHFQTRTTIDTLDYSGTGFNQGSKVVIAARGPAIRNLQANIPHSLGHWLGESTEFSNPKILFPGILIVQAKRELSKVQIEKSVDQVLVQKYPIEDWQGFPLIIISDDSDFTSHTLNNFLWTVFTRSNPATDIHGIGAFYEDKHWGCTGPLVIDARTKAHYAPALIEDETVSRRVDSLAVRGGPLHGII